MLKPKDLMTRQQACMWTCLEIRYHTPTFHHAVSSFQAEQAVSSFQAEQIILVHEFRPQMCRPGW